MSSDQQKSFVWCYLKKKPNQQPTKRKKTQLSKTWENSKNVRMARVFIIYGGIWTFIKTGIVS